MRALLTATALFMTAGCAMAQTPPAATAPAPEPVGMATLRLADGTEAGTVKAFHGPQGILFRVEGQGWPQGWHGVHLHAVGQCEGPGFTSAGAHVNHPTEARPHGLLNPQGGPDLGDLQNVYAGADGTAMAEVYLPVSGHAGHNLMDADGVAFLVHANPDDHVSQPIGGAGARIACGVFTTASE